MISVDLLISGTFIIFSDGFSVVKLFG